MADLGKTNAEHLQFATRIAVPLLMGRDRFETLERYSLERTKVIDFDPNANTRLPAAGVNDPGARAGIVLAGVNWLTNTHKAFKLYVRVTGGSNPRTVKLYTATGGTGEVATGTGNSGTDIALTASNGSGITGTFPLASSVTVETSDLHVLHVRQDWLVFARNVFAGNDPEGEDSKSLLAVGSALREMARRDRANLDEVVRLLERLMIADPENENDRAYGSRFLDTVLSSLISETPTVASGVVERLREGGFPAWYQAQVDEATGSTQTYRRRLVAGAAGVAGSNNTGLGVVALHVPEPYCPTGDYTLVCVAGLGDGKGGSEEFRVDFASDIDDRARSFDRRLTIKKSYQGEDGFGGVGITMTRTLTKSDDAGNDAASAVAAWTVNGETEDNTSDGDLYGKLVAAGGSTFIMQFYSREQRATGDLVCQAPAVAANVAFDAAATRGSGLSIQGTMGDAPSDGAEFVLHLNFHKKKNAAGEPDTYRIRVSLTDEGSWSRILAKLPLRGAGTAGYKLNGVSSGELISEDYMAANNQAALISGPTS